MSLASEQSLESAYVMGTFARKPVELVRGSGMAVFDDEGREYLDFIGGIGAVSLGHCHPAVTAALSLQAEKLVHVSNYYYVEHRGEVARLLSGLLNQTVAEADKAPWKTFFANSGAEANECAFKLARLHAKKRAMAAAEAAGADEDGVRAAAAAARLRWPPFCGALISCALRKAASAPSTPTPYFLFWLPHWACWASAASLRAQASPAAAGPALRPQAQPLAAERQ